MIQIGGGESPAVLAFDDLPGLADPASVERLQARAAQLQFDDPINIQFTSGTTGTPKGATLTHHNILNNGFFVGEEQRLADGDRVCIPVPLYHCFGMVLGNLACLTHASTMIYPAEGFDARAVLETVAAERCTALYGVPTMFIAELEHPEFGSFDLRSLRTGIMAGSPCPVEVMRRVVAAMHMREVTICYGMAGQMAQYTKSGAAPGKFVGQGEAAVAIVFSHDIVNEIENNKNAAGVDLPRRRHGLRNRWYGT